MPAFTSNPRPGALVKLSCRPKLFAALVLVPALLHAETPAGDFKIKGDAAKGEAHYKAYCVTCHGPAGDGDGPAAVALNPKPRKFSDKTIMSAIPDKQMFDVIKSGGPAAGKAATMPAWGAVLKDDQGVHDVAAYVRSLAK